MSLADENSDARHPWEAVGDMGGNDDRAGADRAASSRRSPRFKRLIWATDRRRLDTYLEAYEDELEKLIRMADPPVAENGAKSSALRVVRRAKREVQNGSTNTGWSCYNAAKRIEALGFDQKELERLRDAVLAETQEKVRSSWRQHGLIV
ncbi:hypothetical protein [Actinoplanes sp. DH11]|uniref:hypothetical protein n=1 Tax=Actinoplanes sp. DH11 TaxID=2857011 RepID=UPI001E32121D|nr:hypothetical protein [Actinoplanes sp. DH11]